MWAFEGNRIEKCSAKLPSVVANFKEFERRGVFATRPTLIIPSSGNFLKDAGAVAKGYDVEAVLGVLPASISAGKLKQVEAVGVTPMVTPKGMSTVEYAYQLESEGPNRKVMNQYIEDATIVGQGRLVEHVGAESKRLGWHDEDVLVGAVTGTCGTVTAIHRYRSQVATGSVKVFAVASHDNRENKVPASRAVQDFEELRDMHGERGFMFRDEWNDVLDFPIVTNVSKGQAFAMNAELFGYHYPVGPTGALLTAGLYQFLEDRHASGELQGMLARVHNIVLIWMDSYYAYDDEDYRKILSGAK